MRAMVITGFGGPEVFERRDAPKPEPGPGQVLVKVYASSINPVDYKIRQAGQWAGIQPPAIIGYDVSGVVEAVGPGARDFKPGDEVYYTPEIFTGQGSYAEYHVADERIVARKPANLSFAEAAAVPLAGGTAWVAIVERLRAQPGETVLIHGAGGVGLFALQIAKAAGARVLITSGDATAQIAQDLGADRVIRYRSKDFAPLAQAENGGAGVDAVFDTVGGDLLARSVAVTRPHGRIGGVADLQGDLNAMFFKNQTFYGIFLERARDILDHLRPLIERGQVKSILDSTFPLEQVGEAQAKLERGGVRGKIALNIAQQ